MLQRNLSKKFLIIVIVVLVLLQGLLFSFVYMSKQAQAYTTEMEQMAFEKGQKFTIANIPERKKQKVKSKLFSLANKNNLVLLRISSLSNEDLIKNYIALAGFIFKSYNNAFFCLCEDTVFTVSTNQ